MTSSMERTVTSAIAAQLMILAVQKKTTTYEELALLVGLPSRGNAMAKAVGDCLTRIFHFCVEKNWPHMTALVVRKSGENIGLPGSGFWNLLEEVKAEEAEAYTSGALFAAPKQVRASIAGYLQLRCYAFFEKLNEPSPFEEYQISGVTPKVFVPLTPKWRLPSDMTGSLLSTCPNFIYLKQAEQQYVYDYFKQRGVGDLRSFVHSVGKFSPDLARDLPKMLHYIRRIFSGQLQVGKLTSTQADRRSSMLCETLRGWHSLEGKEKNWLTAHFSTLPEKEVFEGIDEINDSGSADDPESAIRNYILKQGNPQ